MTSSTPRKIRVARWVTASVVTAAIAIPLGVSAAVASSPAPRSAIANTTYLGVKLPLKDPSTLAVVQHSGGGTFVDTATHKAFVPRGADYIRVAQNALHSTFVQYSHARAASAFAKMRSEGYNVVRVYLPYYAIGNPTGPGLSATVVANVADFMRLASSYSVKVLLTSDGLPTTAAFTPPHPLAQSVSPSSVVLDPEQLALAKVQIEDLFVGLAKDHAPFASLFGYEMLNEQDFAYTQMPFEVPSTKTISITPLTASGPGATSTFSINPDGSVTPVTSTTGSVVVSNVNPTYRADSAYVGWTAPSTSTITRYSVTTSWSSPYTSMTSGGHSCAAPRATTTITSKVSHVFLTGLGMPYLCSITTTDRHTYSLAASNGKTQSAANVKAMEVNNLMYWQNSLASFTHALIPHLLVCLGTFPPMGATMGLTSLPQYFLSSSSKVDFVDMHFYPSYGGSVPGHPTLEQNFAAQVKDLAIAPKLITKPIVMAEFGVWKPSPGAPVKWEYPTAELAAKALEQWQLISCSISGLHVDGWLVWTWDTSLAEKTPGSYTMTDSGSVIGRLLSPKLRPNACKA